jgi:SAM-dependent methyltransferase
MSASKHQWEHIYQQDGWPQREPVPLFYEAVPAFQSRKCCRILDLGCGNGNYIVPFAEKDFGMIGADISYTGLKISKQRLESAAMPVSLVQCDFRFPLPFAESSFDGIWALQSIHHARIDEIRLVIRELWRVLTLRGFMVLSVSGRKDANWSHKEIEPGTYVPIEGPERNLPHHIFTEEEVREEFRMFAIENISSRLNGKVIVVMASK